MEEISTTEEIEGYGSRRVADAVGITFRQLDYWSRIGIFDPSVAVARGSGSRRRYSIEDVRVLRALAALTELGAPISKLRPVVEELSRIPAQSWHGLLFVTRSGRCSRLATTTEPGWVIPLDGMAEPMPPSRRERSWAAA